MSESGAPPNGALPGEERIARWREIEDVPLSEIRDALSYRHVQSVPASEWTVSHGLGKRPAVAVVDSSGKRVFGGLVYVDDDNVRLVFSNPFSGEAYLN